MLIGRVIGLPGQNCGSVGTSYTDTLTRLTFTAGDGTEYQLRDTSSNNGNSATTTWSYCDVGYAPNRGKVFVTDDGSAVTFVSDSDIYDAYNGGVTERIYPSGYLMLPDGSRYRIDDGYVTWIRDRNGNKISFTYGWGGVATITDSLNRVINIGYGDDPATSYNDHDEITWKGYGGTTRTIKIYFSQMSSAMRSGDSVQTYYTLFPDLNGASSSTTFNPTKIASSVELPNGKSYSFKYNRYGELARVELPTGGAIEYDYEAGISGGATSGAYGGNGAYIGKQVYRRVVERRVYKDSGSTYEHRTLISKAEDSSGGNLGYVDVETKNYSGTTLTKERHYFHGSAKVPTAQLPYDYSQWKDGKEWKTEAQNTSGTAIKTTENTWQQPASGYTWPLTSAESSDSVRANNPKITQTLSTLNETSQVAKQTFAYDAHFNQTDVYEFDYGSSSPPSYATRHTKTDYLTTNSVNSINNAGPIGSAYASSDYHIRNLPAKQYVYSVNTSNGTETKIAQTEYEYDKYDTSTYHANLVARSGISGLDSGYASTSTVARGNVTKTTSYSDAAGLTGAVSTHQQYDVAGNVVVAIDARGKSTTFDYSDRYGAPSGEARANSAPSELSSVSQTSFAFPTKITNALSHEVYTQFDYYLGKVVDREDANGVVSSASYSDTLDRPTQVIRASTASPSDSNKSQTTFAYDDTNKIITTTSDQSSYDDNALKGQILYDGLGRTTETRSYENSTDYIIVNQTYDALGRQYQVSNPYRTGDTAVWTTTAYDALGRVISVATPDTATVSTAYDGARVLVTDQAGKQRISQSDAFGRLTNVWEVTASDSATESVSFPGYSGITDGYLTKYVYDALDNLTTVTQQIGTSGTTQTRTFVYDSLKRLTSATNPESGATSYVYDENGNLTEKTDARTTKTTLVYDDLNRPTSKTYSGTTTEGTDAANATAPVYFKYDSQTLPTGAPSGFDRGKAIGRLVAVTYGSSTTSVGTYYGYDSLGRVLRRTQQIGSSSNNYAVQATYDLSGAMTGGTYPSTRTTTYTYDQAGRLSTFSGTLGDGTSRTYANVTQYSAAGLKERESYGTGSNGMTTPLYLKLHYNKRQQLVDLRLGSVNDEWNWNRGLQTFYYGTDAITNWNPFADDDDNNGNVRRALHYVPTAVDGSGDVTTYVIPQLHDYSYDALNRISGMLEWQLDGSGNWQSNVVTQNYGYDRFGNRGITSATGGVNSYNPSYTASTNRISSLTYDSAGNITYDAASGGTMTYDADNHMVTASSGGTYVYDGEGKRVKRTASSQEWWYVYGIGGELIAEYLSTATTTVKEEYGYRGGRLLVLWDADKSGDERLKWLVTDHLGSTRMEADKSGSLAAMVRHDYLPFGEELAAGIRGSGYGYVSTNVRQKFGSKERDTETGLDFFEARYYANTQGRFTSSDPILIAKQKLLDPQQWDMYSYTRNNPIRFTDPTGKYVCADNKVCEQFEKARQKALKSKDADVVRAAAAYGDPSKKKGDSGDNGVYVSFSDNLKGDRAGTVSRRDTGIEQDSKSPNGLRATVNVTIKSDQASNEEVIVHEGSHVADRQDFVNAIGLDGNMDKANALNITLRESEIRAYKLSISYAQRGNQTLNFGPCGLMQECKFPPAMMPALRDQRIDDLLNSQYTNLNTVIFPELKKP
ncbi:MAG: RHS repeat protein [Acidobacteria bacterium]|nr:RHS repeat protein [Acidobacteriota bacterium]